MAEAVLEKCPVCGGMAYRANWCKPIDPPPDPTIRARDLEIERLRKANAELLKSLIRLEGIAENVAMEEGLDIMDRALTEARSAIAKHGTKGG